MIGSSLLLAVANVCVLFRHADATQDTLPALDVQSSTDPFFFHADRIATSDVLRSSFASVFSPTDQVAIVIDRDWVWQRYYEHLMSPTRTTPFVVFFTDDSGTCDEETDANEDGSADQKEIARCRLQREHTATVTAHLEAVVLAKGFPSSTILPIVHIHKTQLPKAFALHRVPSTPSLMWFPPRSTGQLQRFPHPQTNFLSFPSAIDATWVGHNVASFLRRCFAQSEISFPTSNTPKSPPQPVAALEDSLAATLLNALPFVAIIAYAMLMVVEHRVAVLTLLCSRATWLVLAQGVLYVSLSGLFHSIIHGVPAFYAHPHYGVYLIHPSGRKQFFLEGLVNGLWSFVISVALWSMAHVMPTVRSKLAREELFRYSLLGVGVAYMGLYFIFARKHPWLSR